jgi:hypothetical protein
MACEPHIDDCTAGRPVVAQDCVAAHASTAGLGRVLGSPYCACSSRSFPNFQKTITVPHYVENSASLMPTRILISDAPEKCGGDELPDMVAHFTRNVFPVATQDTYSKLNLIPGKHCRPSERPRKLLGSPLLTSKLLIACSFAGIRLIPACKNHIGCYENVLSNSLPMFFTINSTARFVPGMPPRVTKWRTGNVGGGWSLTAVILSHGRLSASAMSACRLTC